MVAVSLVKVADCQDYSEWKRYLQLHFDEALQYSSGQVAYMGYLRVELLNDEALQRKVISQDVTVAAVFNAFLEFFEGLAEYEQELRWGQVVNERGTLNLKFAPGDVAVIVDSIKGFSNSAPLMPSVPCMAEEEVDLDFISAQ